MPINRFLQAVILSAAACGALYRRDRWPDDPAVARTNRLNLTGSFPMASLIAGGAFALASLVLGATDVGLPSLCCAIACGVTFFFMDQYGFR